MEQIAYIALGSNLGDRVANLLEAASRLDDIAGLRVARISSFLDNPAVGGPADSPPFLNAAAELRVSLAPRELLEALLGVEQAMGRARTVHWGPRIIDLDLLLYGQEVIAEPDLHVPHPRMAERDFVLRPLAEVAPNALHPLLHATVRELLERL